MGKLSNKTKLRPSKKNTGSLLKSGINVLQDSLSLIRKKKNCFKSHSEHQMRGKIAPMTSLHEERPCTSKDEETIGMSTHCLISDDGLDDINGSMSDSDSSIEVVRDASCGSPLIFDVLNVPSIVISKVNDGGVPGLLENTNHLNIKHSTMNQSGMEAQMADMENLSPITSNKKRKKIKLLDAANIPSDNEFHDVLAAADNQTTGNTPRHIRKVMNKLRALGTKNPENSDLDSSDGWSPSEIRNADLAKKWIEDGKYEEPRRTYIHFKILPEWKKCIRKPVLDGNHKSLRTSSPSPHTSFARKEEPLQVSSIHECASNASAGLNFESCAKHTINSDEIAPFSTLSFEPAEECSEIIDQGQTPDHGKEIVGRCRDEDQADDQTRDANRQLPKRTPHGDSSYMIDELYHIPSPAMIMRRTGIKAPCRSDVPVDVLCFSD